MVYFAMAENKRYQHTFGIAHELQVMDDVAQPLVTPKINRVVNYGHRQPKVIITPER
jgi:hypothetical protein